jgi:malonyl-CoA O-methyltransferase
MPDPSDLDRSAVRRQFDRRADVPDPGDFLLREVERRMLERLDLVRVSPERILDVGCGLGDGVRRLRGRWTAAEVVGVDHSSRRVARAASIDRPSLGAWAQGLKRRLTGRPADPGASGPLGRYLVGDAHCLPVAPNSVDLVWSNLALHWFDDVPAAIGEWYRVIRPGGLLMFSAFGVDTLAEVRALGLGLPALPDMHDIGDALVAAGFAEPVMDTERLSVTWTDPARLVADLRGLGGDARRSRPAGLATPRRRDAALAGLRALGRPPRGTEPAVPMSVGFELIYGHAWCGARKKLPDGYAPIEFRAARPGDGR